MEVLAPAGSLEIFKSVIDAGADAVYFGGKLFSARAYANNFDLDESREALAYAHLHNKKAYLTLNTLVKNIEFNKDLFDYINFYYEYGLDGIIVQDIGVIKYIRDNFPNLNVHASTQMAICNSNGAKLLEDMGVTRIVPARELSLNEIKTIHNNSDVELEVFVHGALCYCYSGDCLFSSLVGGRSGNRGRCAQPCRLEYDVYDADKAVNTKGAYILSLKDLCGIKDLYNLYKNGVSSLKIEGRMKQKQYATNVVNVYRRYVDRLMDNIASGHESYSVDKKYEKLLFDLGNRCGFTNSYYYNNTDDMVTFTRPNHKSSEIEYNYSEDKIPVKCQFVAHIGEEVRINLNYNDISIDKRGLICDKASKKPVTSEDIGKRLCKTGDTSFVIQATDYDIDDNIFIPLGEIGRLRREALEELQAKLLAPFKRTRVTGDITTYEDADNNNIKSISRLIISVSNKQQLEAVNNSGMESNIDYDLVIPMSDYDLFKEVADNKEKYKARYIFAEFPLVIRAKALKLLEDSLDKLKAYDGYVVSSYDGLSFAKEHLQGIIIAGSHLYTYNNNATHFLSELGADYNIAPLELNNKELSHRNNNNSIMTIYGRYPMMITANCINKNCLGCDNKEKLLTIKDKKGHAFPVRNFCKICYNVIYNDAPTYLLDEYNKLSKMGFNSAKIDFVDVDSSMIQDILNQYIDAFCDDKSINSNYKYTKGHMNRGVD